MAKNRVKVIEIREERFVRYKALFLLYGKKQGKGNRDKGREFCEMQDSFLFSLTEIKAKKVLPIFFRQDILQFNSYSVFFTK